MSRQATSAPPWARRSAVARPIPRGRAAPVTSAIFPANGWVGSATSSTGLMIPHFCGRASTECRPLRPQILWWLCSWRHQDLSMGDGVGEGTEGGGDAYEGGPSRDHRIYVDVSPC